MTSVREAVDEVGLEPTSTTADKSSMTTNKFNTSKAAVQVLTSLTVVLSDSAILRDILGIIPDTHTRHANLHKMCVNGGFVQARSSNSRPQNEGRSLQHYTNSLP